VSADVLVSEAERIGSVLAFLLFVTVTAELLDAAGVFRAASHLLARAARGSGTVLWLLSVALATVVTVFLSLDTTAVLLTPVLLTMARGLGERPWPFALATVWLANSASLLLPVSNLTNLLLVHRLDWSVWTFATHMWAPALVSVVVTIGLLVVVCRREVPGDYRAESATWDAPPDRVLLRVATVAAGILVVLLVAEVPPYVAAGTSMTILLVAFAWRRRPDLRWSLFPVRLVVLTTVLFAVVTVLSQLGLLDWLRPVAGEGEDWLALLRLSAVAGVASNAVNNLPAYLALEPVALDSTRRMLALLIGTNVGPLITIWGSLATILWRDRCRSADVEVSWQRFALLGAVAAPVLLVTTVSALAWVG
jgi:arsenical pump membrane protein